MYESGLTECVSVSLSKVEDTTRNCYERQINNLKVKVWVKKLTEEKFGLAYIWYSRS